MRPRFRPHAALALAFGLWAELVACGGSGHSTATSDAMASMLAPRETSEGGYFVVCTPRPTPIPLNQIFALDVSVFTDAAGSHAASNATVHVDAGMPAHHHGMNLVPRVDRVGDGRFRVEGMLMHMPGAWEIVVDVVEGNHTERAKFEVHVR